jgi:uncharacterized protein YggU (UPF0235/DUF167 family)
MKIIVKAKTKAKITKVERVDQPAIDFPTKGDTKKIEPVTYKVSVKEAPIGGKANEAIIKALADYFDISKSNISLVSGQSSKQKIFEIG